MVSKNRDKGRERGREEEREREREGGRKRKRGREEEREGRGGREGGRKREREGEGGREGGREGGKRYLPVNNSDCNILKDSSEDSWDPLSSTDLCKPIRSREYHVIFIKRRHYQ